MEPTCLLCGTALAPAWWLQVDLPCGHGFHFTCARDALLEMRRRQAAAPPQAKAEACHAAISSCVTCRDFFLSPAGLPLMYDECSEKIRRKYKVGDVEFWHSQELVLGRPVTKLKEFPSCVFNLTGLRCLDFCGHPITRVPAEIGKMVSLKRLVLVALFLESLPDELGELTNLEQLLVSCCSVKHLPPTISKLTKLWDFYLDGNQLKGLPAILPPRIDGIKASGNLLTELPDSLAECKGLKNIRAYGNKLTSLPNTVCFARNLVELSVQGNFLTALPDQIDRLQSLKYLAVHDNRLELLPDSLAYMSELRWLYAYNNRLTRLPPNILTLPPRLERLLVEENLLTAEAVVNLLSDVPACLRAVGIDAAQMSEYEGAAATGALGRTPPLPQCVMSGWMLPWGRVYAKLIPSSQLRRQRGVRPVSGALEQRTQQADVLVVAFAASQAEPEWFGLLGLIAGGRVSPADARRRISRKAVPSFGQLHRDLHGSALPAGGAGEGSDAARLAMATAWCAAPATAAEDGAAASMAETPEFDALFLCDTNAQWYLDIQGHELGLRAKLQELASRYRRVMFVGVSMGGFGSLLHSDLAHTVVVFGPQTDLRGSHLRPGLPRGDLEAATEMMQATVRNALRAGTRFEYHVAMEDHLLYARRLPLPATSLVVHPIDGRIARVLDTAGLLLPIVLDLITELHADGDGGARPWAESVAFHSASTAVGQQTSQASSPPPRPLNGAAAAHPVVYDPQENGHSSVEDAEEPVSFCWRSTKERTLLARWGGSPASSVLSFAWVSGQQISVLCKEVPRIGAWFCSRCYAFNGERADVCAICKAESAECLLVVGSGPREQRRQQPQQLQPQQWQQLVASKAQPGDRAGGRPLPGPWTLDGDLALRKELTRAWCIEKSEGQRWTWRSDDDGRSSGFIEFCLAGELRTSWGLGAWARLPSGDLEISFGAPPCSWRLQRTVRGFLATPACGTKLGKHVGWPVCGEVPEWDIQMSLRRIVWSMSVWLGSALSRLSSRKGCLVSMISAAVALFIVQHRRRLRRFLHRLLVSRVALPQ